MTFVSVVIPTHRRPEKLARVLESLATQELAGRPWEVVVVGDGGAQWHRSTEECYPARFLSIKRGGAGAARNHGVAHSRGEWILFTDDDCVAPPSWLADWVRFLEQVDADVGMVGARIRALSTPRNELEAGWFLCKISHLSGPLVIDGVTECIPTANAAVRRACFDRAGGFDRRFTRVGGEDSDLTYRVRQKSAVAFAPEPFVYHDNHVSHAGLAVKYYHYGVGVGRHVRLRDRRASEGLFVAKGPMGILARLPSVVTGAFREAGGVQTRTIGGRLNCALCFVLMRVAYQAGGAWAFAQLRDGRRDS